jgi:hypothetical protein
MNHDEKILFGHYMKALREMKDSIEGLRKKAVERHAETLSAIDALRAAEMRGALWALDEHEKRFHSNVGLRPEWLQQLAPLCELQEPYQMQPGRADQEYVGLQYHGRGRRRA